MFKTTGKVVVCLPLYLSPCGTKNPSMALLSGISLLRQSVCTHSQPLPRKLCVDDNSLDSLVWCALVLPLFWALRTLVGLKYRYLRRDIFGNTVDRTNQLRNNTEQLKFVEYPICLSMQYNLKLAFKTTKEMEEHLNKLNTESKKSGLKIHKGKTKFMTNFETDEEIKIENEKLKKVELFRKE